MNKTIKIALLQCKIVENYEKMNAVISSMIRDSKLNDPDLIVLPERWRYFSINKKYENSLQMERGKDYEFIKNLAKQNNVSIISGGIWERRHGVIPDKPLNFITCYFFDENGKEMGRQDKLHLYSYESSFFQPGSSLNIFLHKKSGIKFSILICFDIAFYETPRFSVLNGSDLLISPTLIRKEGLDNWKTYLKARALENRVPVVACNPIFEYNDRFFIGKSKIISFKQGYESPSCLIVNESNEKPCIHFGEIDVDYPRSIRKNRLNEKINMEKIIIKKHF